MIIVPNEVYKTIEKLGDLEIIELFTCPSEISRGATEAFRKISKILEEERLDGQWIE